MQVPTSPGLAMHLRARSPRLHMEPRPRHDNILLRSLAIFYLRFALSADLHHSFDGICVLPFSVRILITTTIAFCYISFSQPPLLSRRIFFLLSIRSDPVPFDGDVIRAFMTLKNW